MNCNFESNYLLGLESTVNDIFNFRKIYKTADIGYKLFLSVVTCDDVVKDIYLSEAEVKVLDIAITRNRGIVSYCNNDKKEIINSLYAKELIHLSDDGEMFIVDKLFDLISSFNKDSGYIVFDDDSNTKYNKNNNRSKNRTNIIFTSNYENDNAFINNQNVMESKDADANAGENASKDADSNTNASVDTNANTNTNDNDNSVNNIQQLDSDGSLNKYKSINWSKIY